MRRAVPLIIGGVVGTAILVWALSLRDRARTPVLPEAKPSAENGTLSPVNRETLRALARELPGSEKAGLRETLLGLLREAAQAYRERDFERVGKLLTKITDLGSGIQRLLAKRILETGDQEEQLIGAIALEKVATKEVTPFALALAQSTLPDDVRVIAVRLLTLHEVARAAGPLEIILFGQKISTGLQKQIVLFFSQTGNAQVLAKAAVAPVVEKAIRSLAARTLAGFETEEAAQLLLETWKRTFVPTTRQAQANSHLLRALASMDEKILRTVVLAWLETETDLSRRNFIFEMISRSDPVFALETLRKALETETAPQVRTQVIAALGSVGGKEVQEILLGLFGSPDKDEALASLNALLMQSSMEVPFKDLLALLGEEKNPVHRTVLCSLLAKYGETLDDDLETARNLLAEATDGMNSDDPAVRGLSINLYAALARYGENPAESLIGIYSGLSTKEQAAHPVLFQEITKRIDDPLAMKIVETTLANHESASTIRWQAANALFDTGATAPVYKAIASEKSPEMMNAFVGIALARGEDDTSKRLTEIADGMKDSPARNVLLERLKVWTAKDEFQVN